MRFRPLGAHSLELPWALCPALAPMRRRHPYNEAWGAPESFVDRQTNSEIVAHATPPTNTHAVHIAHTGRHAYLTKLSRAACSVAAARLEQTRATAGVGSVGRSCTRDVEFFGLQPQSDRSGMR